MVSLPDPVVELPDLLASAPPMRRRTPCTSSWSSARAAISPVVKDALGYNQRQVAALGIAKDPASSPDRSPQGCCRGPCCSSAPCRTSSATAGSGSSVTKHAPALPLSMR
ncbi:hypothetical protein ACQ4PT_056719 [Festuca glaucescens]